MEPGVLAVKKDLIFLEIYAILKVGANNNAWNGTKER